MAEAALALARIDAFPPYPKLRRLARWADVRQRAGCQHGVELPEQRAERMASERAAAGRRAWTEATERMARWGLGAPTF